jgi:Zn-dependent M28 family amino/carboxypeptidase
VNVFKSSAAIILLAFVFWRPEDPGRVLKSITADSLLHHIKILASDEFEGRAPGTRGEQLTVEYLTDQFKKLGLKPGNPDGTYVQDVPLVAIKGRPTAYLTVGKKKIGLNYPTDYVALTRHSKPEVKIEDSELYFVGYGIVAPEYGWEDYKDVDLRGKTLVVLINDPPVPDPSNPSRLDGKVFEGNAMTYYGRWTYKFEIAAKKGAAAAILIHEQGPAGYPYGVLVGSSQQESFSLEKAGQREDRVPVESWISTRTARMLFSLAGKNFDQMKKSALSRSFRPLSLKAGVTFVIRNTVRQVRSRNVVAKLEGSDPKLRTECVIYSAHWDHLGRNEKLKGDQIYNGAIDNASGTAGLLEIAKAYSRLGTAPRRTILFLSPTAEEKGLLGARYYIENPIYPLSRTLADINMDCLNPWGRTRDLIVIGSAHTALDDIVSRIAKSQGRRVIPDIEPEKGFFFRSDQFEFARRGIPTLYTDGGVDLVGKPVEYGLHKRSEYTSRDYHRVTDEVKPDWDLSGSVEDLRLLFLVGYTVACN